jgi:hypothetical protein
MITQIDHLVLLVSDLDAAILGATTAGFTVTPGGRHDTGGTHNALIPFRDGSYIELLGFEWTVAPDHYFAERFARGPGLGDLALLSDDLDADLGAMGERGVSYPDPVELARKRPDGVRVAWRMSLAATRYPGRGYPFLIQDTTDRSLRVAGDSTHANGATGIAGVSVVTEDINRDARILAALVGVPDTSSRFGLAGKGHAILRFAQGRQWLALVQAMPDTMAAAHLDRFGAGPFALSLRTDEGSEVQPWDGSAIDPTLVAGARILVA